ncbi:hypothetical protein [Rhizobium sp.]|uniref:hypothetical protein n=1 Tax=Rhizobium sp. TaxID=391 RepID=UPI003F7E0787
MNYRHPQYQVAAAEEMTVTRTHTGLAQTFPIPPTRTLAMSPEHMLFDDVISALVPAPGGGVTMICLTLGPALARDVSDRIAYFHQDVMTEIGKSEKIFGAARYQPKSLSSVC